MLALTSFWPFSVFKFDDLRVSDKLVRRLSVPESTKHFVYAVEDAGSKALIYVLCVQDLSERSVLDVDCLIKEVKPDAVVVQMGPVEEGVGGSGVDGKRKSDGGGRSDGIGDEIMLPTSVFEVLKRSFLEKICREQYETVAGILVLKEIFGVGFNGHFFAAKRAAEEVGSAFLFLDSPSVKCIGEDNGIGNEMLEKGNSSRDVSLQVSSLVQRRVAPMATDGWRLFSSTSDTRSQMIKLLSSYLFDSSSVGEVGSEDDIKPELDYEPPLYARSIYPLLLGFHKTFVDSPSMERALFHAQKMLSHIEKGEILDNQLLSEVYTYRIAVEGLRVALNYLGRLPISKLGTPEPNKTNFSELSLEDKSHALLAQALRSQTKKFRSIVAVIDASDLAGLRRNWNTLVPNEFKDMVEQMITNRDDKEDSAKNDEQNGLLTDKPVVAVGAGATALLGASSLYRVLPASSYIKIVTLNVPNALKLMVAHTQKSISILLGKSLGASKVGVAGSGVKTSFMKAGASAERIRRVAHGVVVSAEKTSLSAMRESFYEIMRQRRVRPIRFLPLGAFCCSMATCSGLLMYGDGIECAAELLPTAPLIASMGRGIQSLFQISAAVRHTESSRIRNSVDSLLTHKKIKSQLTSIPRF